MIIDVHSSRVPAQDPSLFVANGLVSIEEPSILPVVSPRSLFGLEGKAVAHRVAPLSLEPDQVIGMKDASAYAWLPHLSICETHVVEHPLVRIDRRYAAVGSPNQVVSASASPTWVRSPTQATYPSGRTKTAVGGATTPIAGSSHVP